MADDCAASADTTAITTAAATYGKAVSRHFRSTEDEHLLTVLRYVRRNPLRANLVTRAEEWAWSSLAWRPTGKRPGFLADAPVVLPRNWVAIVNKPQNEVELAALQRSLSRGTPLGDAPVVGLSARQSD